MHASSSITKVYTKIGCLKKIIYLLQNFLSRGVFQCKANITAATYHAVFKQCLNELYAWKTMKCKKHLKAKQKQKSH